MRRGAGSRFALGLALCVAFGVLGALFAEQHAEGQGRPRAPATGGGPKKPPAEIGPLFTLTPELVQKLKSGDEAQARAALDDVRLANKAAASAVPAIADLLGNGASITLTEAALDTLGEIESPTASPAVAAYATHRSLKIRRAAVRALVRVKGSAAVVTLRRALSDPDPQVRGLAATGLGSMKAKDATPDLVVALDHKVPEAAASIGQLCTATECDELLTRVGKLPFDIMTTGLDQVLFRPAEEIPDDAKIKVIGRVRELGTMEANKFLHDVQTRWPKNWSARIRQAIDQAVLATSGGAQ